MTSPGYPVASLELLPHICTIELLGVEYLALKEGRGLWADRKFKRPFGATPIPRRVWRPQGAAAAPPERPTARRSAAERDWH